MKTSIKLLRASMMKTIKNEKLLKEEQKPSIAVCHHTLMAMGGGERVGATLIEALNDIGIIPDVYSVSPVKQKYLQDFYGKNLKYRMHFLSRFTLPILGIYQKLLTSFTAFRLTGFDVVINTTGVYTPMFFRRLLKRYILYVYNPVALMKEHKEVPKPLSVAKYDRNLFWKAYFLPYRLLLRHSVKNLDAELIAVSKFTQYRLKRWAGLESNVVYPPVDIKLFSRVFGNTDRDGVISIGRFTPEKEHLTQLSIASKLPDITFRICGSAKTPYYLQWFKYLKAKAEEMELKNVEFYPNIPIDNLLKLIGTSKVFIHTMEYEDFGLTTCESIAGGCVPCVIDSGGQKEIVPTDNLRFQNVNEAVKIIKRIVNLRKPDFIRIKNRLFEHVKQFDEVFFKDNMFKVIFQ
jgi:glycosyltransferase involved in cell wall biosynthesis